MFENIRRLAIDDKVLADAAKVKAHAIERRETLKQIAERESTNSPGPANDPNHILLVPNGYRIIYSIEQQPVGWCQHFSISVDNAALSPNPDAVALILQECFGIRWNMRPQKPNPAKPDYAIKVWSEPGLPNVPHLLFPFKFTKPAVEGTPGSP